MALNVAFFAVHDDFDADLVTFEKTRDDSLTACHATTLAAHAVWAEVRLSH